MSRSFPGIAALVDVSFDVAAGEVHALVGENGAGKSTLINLVAGVLRPDTGEMLLSGESIELGSPVDARRLGIVTVHQEAELFATLSVAENMALTVGLPRWGGVLVDRGRVWREARRVVAHLREAIDVSRPASRLSVAQRHLVQVATAVEEQARLVVLDEPTSALSAAESQWLFAQIERLRRAGVGIVYVSHRQDEIFRLADRITVLRDGRRVWSGPTAETAPGRLVELMVGRELSGCNAVNRASTARESSDRAARNAAAPPRLELRGLSSAEGRVQNVSLTVRAGEVVGLYGLVGAGRTELARLLFGLDASTSGGILIDGRPVRIRSTADAMRAGIAYLPEDRLREGICRELSVRANTVLATLDRYERGLLASAARERTASQQQLTALGARYRDLEQPIGELSGGNQQKVVLGRWLLSQPRVLVLDEPTRGVDVRSKAEIHRLLADCAAAGCALLLISSDLPEVLANSDRVLVFRHGQIAGQFVPGQCMPAEVASAALPPNAAPTIPATDSAIDGARAVRRPIRRRVPPSEVGLAIGVGALAIVLAATADNFLTANNLRGLATGASVWTILALAAAPVIIAGGIDISIGAIFALAAAVGGLVMKLDALPLATVPAGIAAGLTVALGAGLINAALALVGRLHPIVVTLGMMGVYRGLLSLLTGGQTIHELPRAFDSLANGRIAGVNGSVLVLVVTIAAAQLWLAHSVVGRHLYAVGASNSAARLAGISRGRAWLVAFGGGALLAGLAGLLQLAQDGSMQSVMGTGYELRAIAAAVIGGVAISGGRGSVIGVVLGALLLSLVSNALVLWQISRYHHDLVVGGLILTAVLWDLVWRKFER
ncbi:MAG: ATP-binding cassette domain-containing protein [Pirellulales bacterium]|nr:ATP-binding cassette domain-containing protein [Pirellulales bacterium]